MSLFPQPDLNAHYWVQMRHCERQLLRNAIEWAGTAPEAANLLGISRPFFYKRARILGGVFEGEPEREPFTENSGSAAPGRERDRDTEPDRAKRNGKKKRSNAAPATARNSVAPDRDQEQVDHLDDSDDHLDDSDDHLDRGQDDAPDQDVRDASALPSDDRGDPTDGDVRTADRDDGRRDQALPDDQGEGSGDAGQLQ